MKKIKQKLEIKTFHSPDIPYIENWKPNYPKEVCYYLEFEIGEVNRNEVLLFGINVATQEGLKFYKQTFPQALYDPIMMIENYEWIKVKNIIVSKVLDAQSYSWEASIAALKETFSFEYG